MNANLRIRKLIFFVAACFFLVLSDQFIKHKIRTSGGFYVCNQNLAFDLSFSFLVMLFGLILIIALVIANFGNSKSETQNSKQHQNSSLPIFKPGFHIFNFKNLNLFSISDLGFWILSILIISGALSNIIDRLYLGCVIDFIDLKFWPVFNLADVYITIGATVLVIRTIREKKLVK